MRKQSISFAQVIKLLQHIKLKGVLGRIPPLHRFLPPNALHRNGPECAEAFDYIESIKSDVTKVLIQVGNLAERGPLATVGAH